MERKPEILTAREAAELLRVTERSIAKYKAEGRLPALSLGSNYVRFRRDDVLALLSPAGPSRFNHKQPVTA